MSVLKGKKDAFEPGKFFIPICEVTTTAAKKKKCCKKFKKGKRCKSCPGRR